MKFIIIGSSTGGPRVLFDIFADLPLVNSVIIVVQHMPVSTTPRLVKRISQLTSNKVVVASNMMKVQPGTIFIAPGDQHLIINSYDTLQLSSSEKVNFVRPSIDVTMLSLGRDLRHSVLGMILSGMGVDGAEGIAHIKDIGGVTAIQDLPSCTIKSMPEAALKTDKIDHIVPPEGLKKIILEFSQSGLA
jgi:two-component system, chemotaxis family, protein-glutamate methylesterase/glutaminase